MLRWILGALFAYLVARFFVRLLRVVSSARGSRGAGPSVGERGPAAPGRRASGGGAPASGIDRSSVIDVPYTEVAGEESKSDRPSDSEAKAERSS